jgi:hypothetical protein
MTEAKKLKKAIRARARKTGERYTAARRHVLLARGKGARAGLSDAAVVKRTGQGLDHWFGVLDAFGAAAKGHTAAARHLARSHGVPGWHAQMITVAYERVRGMRAPNQAGRTFQVSVSKTVRARVDEVARAITDAGRRAQWLRAADRGLARALEAGLTRPRKQPLRMVKSDDHARLRYAWNGAPVEIRVYGKPKGAASIVADNKGLPDAAAVERRRVEWRAALAALAAFLAG